MTRPFSVLLVEDDDPLRAVLFELLRFKEGDFEFDADSAADNKQRELQGTIRTVNDASADRDRPKRKRVAMRNDSIASAARSIGGCSSVRWPPAGTWVA